MAKKAIDFLFSHSSERDQLVIGFYGGEPLLEFDLITQIVEYSESIGWGKKLRYVVTTNATLLTDKVLDFFVRYNFDVMISFDGPKEVHDKNRRFANGQGSFDLIMDNLENARRRYPDFYKKIMTNTVLSPEEDYSCVKRFFDADSLVSELNSRLSLISEEDIKEKITYGEALTISQQEEFTKIYLHLLKKIDSDNISKLYLPLEEFIIKTYFDLKQEGNQQYKIDHPGGPCVPGKRRVFVDINGLLYPCEKISECREASIGSLEEGFDFSAINRLINIGKLTEKACKSCWAFVFCNQCANSAFDHGKLSASARLARCQSAKAVALNSLRTVILLEHYGFDFERWNANNENRDIWSE